MLKPNTHDTMSRDAQPLAVAAAALFAAPGQGRAVRSFKPKQTVIVQGDPAAAVYYIGSGNLQLTIVSGRGKEAVIAILGAGDFFGEGCIAGQTAYHSSAITMTACRLVRIERDAMLRLMQEQPAILDTFMRFLLSRSVRIEADLIDQLLNSTERRLARTLSLLADLGPRTKDDAVIPRISQDVLAAKVGTTRSRINYFMNKFRKLGLVEYGGASEMLKVRSSLRTLLVDDPLDPLRSAPGGRPTRTPARWSKV